MVSDRIKDIGLRIRKYRKAKHLSQDELSGLAHIAPTYLSDIENGKVNLSVEVFLRLTEALDVSVEELLGIRPLNKENLLFAEITGLFSDCSEKEKKMLLAVLKNVKNEVKKLK